MDSLNALGTTIAFPDTMLSGSAKKSERSQMKNTIALKKNSGSQGGMNMKATPRKVKKFHSAQTVGFCFLVQLRNSSGFKILFNT